MKTNKLGAAFMDVSLKISEKLVRKVTINRFLTSGDFIALTPSNNWVQVNGAVYHQDKNGAVTGGNIWADPVKEKETLEKLGEVADDKKYQHVNFPDYPSDNDEDED